MRFIPRFDVRLVRDGRVATLEPTIIRRPEDTLPVLEAELGSRSAEVFLALAMNTKNHVVAILPVSSGSLNASIVHPRELFQRAILANCASLSAPFVTRTFSGFHNVKALTGPADQDRHEAQWQ